MVFWIWLLPMGCCVPVVVLVALSCQTSTGSKMKVNCFSVQKSVLPSGLLAWSPLAAVQ
jgi:hypothetical protein